MNNSEFPMRFNSIVTTGGMQKIAFAFVNGCDLEHIRSFLLDRYPDVITEIEISSSKHILWINIKEFTYEKAYVFKLFIEMALFEKFRAIRVELKEIQEGWHPKSNLPNFKELVTIINKEPEKDTQTIAWDRLKGLVRELSESE